MSITRRTDFQRTFRLMGALALLAIGLPACARARRPSCPHRARGPGWRCTRASSCKPRKGISTCLFLGDSITQGWNENTVWQRFYGPRHAANFGIGGDRTQHVLWRIQNGELEGIAPKVTVLMIGTNNLHDDTPDEIAQGIKTIVAEICAPACPRPRCCCSACFPAAQSRRRTRADQVDQRQDRQARRRVARPLSRYRQVVLEPRRHNLARGHARLSPSEHQGLPHLGRSHGADALVDA